MKLALWLFVLVISQCSLSFSMSSENLTFYREKVKSMFFHAYDGYMTHAFPMDELQPLTCDGAETLGSFSLTLLDSLDTLAVMGKKEEFANAVNLVLENIDYIQNVNVSVFETNIRVVGGLLSAHLLSEVGGLKLHPGWPCHGPLLDLAENFARRLLPAFDTKTGMPYGTVNLMYGVDKNETKISCTATVGTVLLEFGSLSLLTGDDVFKNVADKAMHQLFLHRSPIDLVGNHINTETGKWTATDCSIGGSVDSYFEYMVKAAVLFQEPKWMKQFWTVFESIEQYMNQDDWHLVTSMKGGDTFVPIFQALQAFWPGVLTLVGRLDEAKRAFVTYWTLIRKTGVPPEVIHIDRTKSIKSPGWPLRPEFIESAVYLYRATKDDFYLNVGLQYIEILETVCKTSCGYAVINDVSTHELGNRMESFLLAETFKYLYLLFTPDHFMLDNPVVDTITAKVRTTPSDRCVLDDGGWVFNTEAHPFHASALTCCSAKHRQFKQEVEAQFPRDARSPTEIDSMKLVDIAGELRRSATDTVNRLRRKVLVKKRSKEAAMRRNGLAKTKEPKPPPAVSSADEQEPPRVVQPRLQPLYSDYDDIQAFENLSTYVQYATHMQVCFAVESLDEFKCIACNFVGDKCQVIGVEMKTCQYVRYTASLAQVARIQAAFQTHNHAKRLQESPENVKTEATDEPDDDNVSHESDDNDEEATIADETISNSATYSTDDERVSYDYLRCRVLPLVNRLFSLNGQVFPADTEDFLHDLRLSEYRRRSRGVFD